MKRFIDEHWQKLQCLKNMQEELARYPAKTIEEFNKRFPVTKEYHPPGTPIGGKYGSYTYYLQNIISQEGFVVHVAMSYEDSYDDFWYRWNRFKNLRAFL